MTGERWVRTGTNPAVMEFDGGDEDRVPMFSEHVRELLREAGYEPASEPAKVSAAVPELTRENLVLFVRWVSGRAATSRLPAFADWYIKTSPTGDPRNIVDRWLRDNPPPGAPGSTPETPEPVTAERERIRRALTTDAPPILTALIDINQPAKNMLAWVLSVVDDKNDG